MKSRSFIINLLYLTLLTIILGYFVFQVAGISSIVIVRGGSMEPTLSEGDIVYVIPKNPEKISVGEIVVYKARGITIVHRVVNVTFADGIRSFITKGDANNFTDQDSGILVLKPEDIIGVLASLNGYTLRIPKVGLLYVVVNDFIMYWTSGRLLLIVPSVILGLTIISTLGGKHRKDSYPFTRSKLTRGTLASMMLFTVLLVQLSTFPLVTFRLHSYSVSLAVEAQPTSNVDLNLGSLKPGTAQNATVTLYAFSAIRVWSKGIAYIEGNITQLLTFHNKTVTITPENSLNRIEIFAYAPLNATKGVYTGKLFVYNRPLLAVVPFHNMAKSLLNSNFWNVLTIDFLSNIIVAGALTVLQLIFLKFSNSLADLIIWNYANLEWIGWKFSFLANKIGSAVKKIANKMKKKFCLEKIARILMDMTDETTDVTWNVCPFIIILCFPSLFGYVFTAIILSSVFSAIYMVCIKKSVWKSDITMVSLIISVITSTYYIINWVVINDHIHTIWPAFSFLGVFLYTSSTFLLITTPTIYITALIALKWIGRKPHKSLNTLGDWNVTP